MKTAVGLISGLLLGVGAVGGSVSGYNAWQTKRPLEMVGTRDFDIEVALPVPSTAPAVSELELALDPSTSADQLATNARRVEAKASLPTYAVGPLIQPTITEPTPTLSAQPSVSPGTVVSGRLDTPLDSRNSIGLRASVTLTDAIRNTVGEVVMSAGERLYGTVSTIEGDEIVVTLEGNGFTAFARVKTVPKTERKATRTGPVVGALIGAIAGRNLAANPTIGAVVGAAAGAAAGSVAAGDAALTYRYAQPGTMIRVIAR